VAQVTVRATLRGAQEGSADSLVVGSDGADGTLEARWRGRATLHVATSREAQTDGEAGSHGVVVLPAERPRPGAVTLLEVVVDGWRFEVEVEPEQRAALRDKARRDRGDAGHSGPAEVRARIPGVVVSVAVAPGDAVEAGQQLLVVEAMKMQNELRAPRAGTVERVMVGERSTIEVGDLLVVIE
jgi:biotin carboxyl carrier protein